MSSVIHERHEIHLIMDSQQVVVGDNLSMGILENENPLNHLVVNFKSFKVIRCQDFTYDQTTNSLVYNKIKEFTRRKSGIYALKGNPSIPRYSLVINLHPKISEEKSEENFECLICCETKGVHHKLVCKHSICEECLVSTAVKNQKTCPFCRHPFQVPESTKDFFITCLEEELVKTKEDYKDMAQRLTYARAQLIEFERGLASYAQQNVVNFTYRTSLSFPRVASRTF
jgi:hypothetical protein